MRQCCIAGMPAYCIPHDNCWNTQDWSHCFQTDDLSFGYLTQCSAACEKHGYNAFTPSSKDAGDRGEGTCLGGSLSSNPTLRTFTSIIAGLLLLLLLRICGENILWGHKKTLIESVDLEGTAYQLRTNKDFYGLYPDQQNKYRQPRDQQSYGPLVEDPTLTLAVTLEIPTPSTIPTRALYMFHARGLSDLPPNMLP